MTPIQTNIAGYGGKPCSLFSVYETDTQILSVIKDTDYKKNRQKPDYVLISNDKNADYDCLFTELNFSQGIEDFFTLLNGVAFDGRSSRLVFDDKIARANPKTSLQKNGYTENGQRFELSPDISSLQVAVLATCFYANSKAGAIESTLSMFEQLNEIDYFAVLKSGGMISI
jgi:hypothetical protein